jgi:MFS transporter, DHA1 family, inner membrane transport protein
MDVARDSQSIAAALNHSALNIANSLGTYLGSLTIAAGLGYVSPVWVGIVLSIAGVIIAAFSFSLDRKRRRRRDKMGGALLIEARQPDPPKVFVPESNLPDGSRALRSESSNPLG